MKSIASLSSSWISETAIVYRYHQAPGFHEISTGKTLKLRHLGPAVAKLQAMLRHTVGPVLVDGKFGKATQARLRRFQNQHALVPDGIFGKQTLIKLKASISARYTQMTCLTKR